MATRNEQSQPFLSDDRDAEFELSQLDGDADIRSGDRTPLNHYEPRPPPAQGKTSPWLVAAALFITVLGFTINTEATEYIESVLGWKKPFATMYITHSSLALPWIGHVLWLRYRDRHIDYITFVRSYNNSLRESITSIDAYGTDGPRLIWKLKGRVGGPLDFLSTTMAIITIVLTGSGLSWFLALALTTPADLTAIYNCSTFFAAAFSVPLLHEHLGRLSLAAVALSIIGTFVIAYGDTTAKHDEIETIGLHRLAGNLVAALGALCFGLYEVLLKKWACSSRPIGPNQSLPLTLAASGLTGLYTFGTLWSLLLFLHIFGIETFVWPSAYVWLWLFIAVGSGCISITLLTVLVVWTDPVFGSFANVLSVFFVAISDWMVFGLSPSLATYGGGGLVIVAFGMLSWDTFKGKKH